jgi:hypothetical protein
MPRPKPNRLHDELDALLDGRPVELTDELAPLAEAADALRAELAAYQLDPRVADRHLERVLDGSAPVVRLPVRNQPHGWDVRRRLAAVALAAALVLAPATMASAAALPGQAMYPFKRAIEELRIASVQWSPGREAGERIRVADERLEELDSVVKLRMYTQVPSALKAFGKAVAQAQAALDDARKDGELVPNVEARLNRVAVAGSQVVQRVKFAAESGAIPVTAGTRDAIAAAATQSQVVLPPPTRDTLPADPPSSGMPTPTTQTTQPQTTGTTQTTQTTQTTATTQTTLTQTTPTTGVTTTQTTETSEPEATSASEDGPLGTDAGKAADGLLPDGVPPPTTVPGP